MFSKMTEKQPTLEQLNKYHRTNRVKILLNIVLIIVVCLTVIYLTLQISTIKELAHDPCRICEAKTGGLCVSKYSITALQNAAKQQPMVLNFSFGK